MASLTWRWNESSLWKCSSSFPNNKSYLGCWLNIQILAFSYTGAGAGGWVGPWNMYFNSHVIVVVRELCGAPSYKVWFWKVIKERASLIPKYAPPFPQRYFYFLWLSLYLLYSVPPTNSHSVPLGRVVLTFNLSCPRTSPQPTISIPFWVILFLHALSHSSTNYCSPMPIPSSSDLLTSFTSHFLHEMPSFTFLPIILFFLPQELKQHFLRSLCWLPQAGLILVSVFS